MIRVALFLLIAAAGIVSFPPDAGSRAGAVRPASPEAICWIEFEPGALRHYCREEGRLLACDSPRTGCRAVAASSARA